MSLYRPKPRTCGHIKDDGTRCGSFANSTGLCPTHAKSPGTQIGAGWDRENPYREGWKRPAWKATGDKRRAS